MSCQWWKSPIFRSWTWVRCSVLHRGPSALCIRLLKVGFGFTTLQNLPINSHLMPVSDYTKCLMTEVIASKTCITILHRIQCTASDLWCRGSWLDWSIVNGKVWDTIPRLKHKSSCVVLMSCVFGMLLYFYNYAGKHFWVCVTCSQYFDRFLKCTYIMWVTKDYLLLFISLIKVKWEKLLNCNLHNSFFIVLFPWTSQFSCTSALSNAVYCQASHELHLLVLCPAAGIALPVMIPIFIPVLCPIPPTVMHVMNLYMLMQVVYFF